MLEKAKITDSFELSDEGVAFDEALETLIHSINNEANLTFLGEIAINFQIKPVSYTHLTLPTTD